MPNGTAETVRVCHFSDLHLPWKGPVPLGRLSGKRLLGYANLVLRRARTHRRDACEALLRRLVEERPDLAVMTGDVTNLSVESEFSEADRLFREAGLLAEKTLVIPGNHDRYTAEADQGCLFEEAARPWLPPDFERRSGYPIVRVVGPVVFIGLDTAVWRSAARDAGRVAPDQLARLREVLHGDAFQKLWPVVLLHHPPFRREEAFYKDYLSGLEGAGALVRALEGRAATVLHGHMHVLSRRRIDSLDVIGVSSASNTCGEPARQLAYHLYTFGRDGLRQAEIVRLWPGADGADWRVERAPLPERAG